MTNFNNYVGIDIAKKDFYACFDEQSESKKFNNTALGINAFIRHLSKNDFQNQNTVIGVESTGSYHLRLCLQCSSRGFQVKVINPLIVKKQNQTNLRRVKNDRKDASLIRYCLATGAGYVFSETSDTLLLKCLVRQRNSLVNIKFKNKRQQADVRYKEDCLKVRFNSVYQEISDILSQKIKDLEQQLKTFRPKEQKLLQTIPGVGPTTAVSFIAEVNDIKRFKQAKQLVAYVGLDSRVHQSGTSIHGKGYISKRGNKILRTRLYNATHVAVLHPNLFQNFFQKKRDEGKPYKVALVATMHKMVNVIYSVWINNKPFVDHTTNNQKED